MELLKKALNKDDSAFESIVNYFTPKLKAIGRLYLSSDQNIEDAIQEVWIKVFKNFDTLREPQKFFYWLKRIMKFCCIDKRRTDTKTEMLNVSLDDDTKHYILEYLTGSSEDLSCHAESEEIKEIIWKSLRDLPEIYAIPISLYYIENMKLKEIEEILDLTPSTVKWRLHHGRNLLRKSLRMFFIEG